MANTRSAAKRSRQTEIRTVRNKALKSKVKNARKAVLSAVASGDAELVQKSLNAFSSAADRAAKGNVIHKNAAGRLKSNLAKSVASAKAG